MGRSLFPLEQFSKQFGGDGGPAREASFDGIFNIAFHGGSLYICDLGNRRIRAANLATGLVRTVAGNGAKGVPADGGPAREARLNGPKHLFVEASGDVLISDTENHVVRRYSPRDGRIDRVVGTGRLGSAGVGGPADRCELNRPHGALVHPRSGEIYVSDSENNRVLRLAR